MRPTGPALAAMPLVLARPTCMGLWTLSHPFIDYSSATPSSWARPPSVDAGSFALSIDVGSYAVR